MLVEPRRLTVPPGQRLLLEEVSWDEFEAILEDLGERRTARSVYDNGLLEIITPLPEHESGKVVVGAFITAILEEQDIKFLSWGRQPLKIEKCFNDSNPMANLLQSNGVKFFPI